MKNKFFLYTAFVFLLSTVSYAQQVSLDEIRNYYKSFNYKKVIELSESLLNENTLAKEEIIELEIMKAVSSYSLNDETSARKSFIEILKLDKNYSLDPSFISPKIISLFESTKKDFNQIYADKPEEQLEENIPEEKTSDFSSVYKKDNSDLLKSIIFPGWGHLTRSSGIKGWIITSAGLASLGTMIYYIVDANNKEEEYLNETDPVLIQQKYNSFNTSYKTRNALITAYAAIWVFAQLDLLVFDTEYGSPPISFSSGYNSVDDINISFKIGF